MEFHWTGSKCSRRGIQEEEREGPRENNVYDTALGGPSA